ncbi:MAG: pseudouridine synthase [Saprospiraceae bacterium]
MTKPQKPARPRKRSIFTERLPKPGTLPSFPATDPGPWRLNKYVAHSGLCSRRKAADMIKEGRVEVNGAIQIDPSVLVTDIDKIVIGGNAVKRQTQLVYLLLNKPKNTITSLDDERDRSTIIDLLGPEVKEKVFPVGRLDRNTTGLILLTNDGDLANKLAHPSNKVKKIYHVVLDKDVTKADMEKIRKGLKLDDGIAEIEGVEYVDGKSKSEVGITIHIGRNRIVRRIFEYLGYSVVKLDRVYFAGLTKKDLARGKYRALIEREVIMLKHFSSGKKIPKDQAPTT